MLLFVKNFLWDVFYVEADVFRTLHWSIRIEVGDVQSHDLVPFVDITMLIRILVTSMSAVSCFCQQQSGCDWVLSSWDRCYKQKFHSSHPFGSL